MRSRIGALLPRQISRSSSFFVCDRCLLRLNSPTKRSLFEGLRKSDPSEDTAARSGPKPPALQEARDASRALDSTRAAQSLGPREQSADAEKLDWDGLEWVGSKKWIREVEADRADIPELDYRAAETKLLPGEWVKSDATNTEQEVRKMIEKIVSGSSGSTSGGDSMLPADAGARLTLFRNIVKETGVRIPDGDARKINTVDDLVTRLLARPKPSPDRRVRHHADLLKAPNVNIIPRNRTLRENEDRRKGTSKLISDALTARNLDGKERLSRRI